MLHDLAMCLQPYPYFLNSILSRSVGTDHITAISMQRALTAGHNKGATKKMVNICCVKTTSVLSLVPAIRVIMETGFSVLIMTSA